MKAQVLYDIGDIRFEDIEIPKPKSGEVLIKVKAAGVCGSDIPRIYKTGAHVHPLVPGHEFSGEVVQVGEGVSSDWIGKAVGIFPLIPCKECGPCKNKQYEMCRNYNYLGSRCNGGFAEYVAAPVWNVMRLPEGVAYEQAAMLEPMAVAVHSMRQVINDNTDRNLRVCVCGAGTIGLLLVMFLLDAGFEKVSVICNKESQKKHLIDLGLKVDNIYMSTQNNVPESKTEARSETKFNLEADIFFECVGKNSTAELAIDVTAPAGKVVFVGNPASDMIFSKNVYWKILRNQLSVHGTWNSSYLGYEASLDDSFDDSQNDLNDNGILENSSICEDRTVGGKEKSHSSDYIDDWTYVIDRLAKGSIFPEKFITHRFSIENIQRGFEIMRDKTQEYVKIICVFEG